MNSTVVKIAQSILYCTLAFPVRLLFRVRRRGSKPSLPSRGRFIIASNHPARIDPFLVIFTLPPRTFFSLRAVRFLTAEKYLRGPISKHLLLALGCVSTNPSSDERVLPLLAKFLSRGECVYIFPGGVIERNSSAPTPKVGVVHLARTVPGAKIIPVKITCDSLSLRGVFTRSVRYDVQFGKPFRPTSFPKDLQPLADDVMKRIRTL